MESHKWVLEFHRQVSRGNIKTIKTLLDVKPHDVSIDETVRNSWIANKTALEYCCLEFIDEPTKRSEEIIKLLLQYGADPLQRELKGRGNHILYLLSLARGSDDIVIEFLQYIEEINIPIFGNYNALILSLGTEEEDALKYCLARGADPNINLGGITPLLSVIVYNVPKSIEKMKILIDNGADINKKGLIGMTPLHSALSQSEGKDICHFILKHKPDVKSTNVFGLTPLYDYLWKEHLDLEVLEELLDVGSDPNFLGPENLNSLHIFAKSPLLCERITEVIQILIKYGANINQKDLYGYTPLHYAASSDSAELIESLLMNGADFTLKTNDGDLAMDSSMMDPENYEVALVFIKHIMLQIHSGKMEMTEGISAIIESSYVMRKMLNACDIELLCLKKQQIGDSNITLFKVLISDVETISKFAGNREILDMLPGIQEKGLYCSEMKNKISAGIERRRLKEVALRFCSNSICDILPSVAVRTIVGYLPDSDLKKLEEVIIE